MFRHDNITNNKNVIMKIFYLRHCTNIQSYLCNNILGDIL